MFDTFDIDIVSRFHLSSIQVRFKNNIPSKCAIINCTLRLYCIDYCQIVIKPTDLKLLHFLNMRMCIRIVFGFSVHEQLGRIGGRFSCIPYL